MQTTETQTFAYDDILAEEKFFAKCLYHKNVKGR
jgi:hypothetical protein